jgi:hypothetical protein
MPGEILPARHGNIDISRAQLDRMAAAAGHFRRDYRGAGADEGIVNRLARRGIVFDRPLHALDGLLSRVTAIHFLSLGNIPHCSLIASAVPRMVRSFEGVPADLVLPMVVGPTDNKWRLAPNEL